MQQRPQRFGPYAVLDQIGHGGMGTVYRALDTRLRREVALKVLHRNLDVSGARERFLHEAQIVSSLSHPNICTVFDIGEQGDDLYLVLELLRGHSIKDLLGKGPVATETVHKTALQIAHALTAAHGRGIVHRDIKPANLFVTEQEWSESDVQIKVLDFGLAKSATAQGLRKARSLTRHGATVGTVEYMSPEQACGQDLDGRSDLFSLGAVLYEMATGQAPFSGATSAVIYSRLLNDDPTPPREANLDVPPELDRIIRRLLNKDRANRFQTASELAWELQECAPRPGAGRTGETFSPPRIMSSAECFGVAGTSPDALWEAPAQIAAALGPTLGEGSIALNFQQKQAVRTHLLRSYIPWRHNDASWSMRSHIRMFLACTMFLLLALTIHATLIQHRQAAGFRGILQVSPLINHTGIAALDWEPTRSLQKELKAYEVNIEIAERQVSASAEDRVSSKEPPVGSTDRQVGVVSGVVSAVREGYLVHLQLLNQNSGQILMTADETAPSLEQIPVAVSRAAQNIRQALQAAPVESDSARS